jgi:hypothetical protein
MVSSRYVFIIRPTTYLLKSSAQARADGPQVSCRHYIFWFAQLTTFWCIIGELNVGKAPGCVPISALGYVTSDGGAEQHVYWRNLENEIVGTKNTGSWGPVNKVIGGLKSGTQFAATHWSKGKNVRLYYQTPDDSVLEMRHDGDSWSDGATVCKAR